MYNGVMPYRVSHEIIREDVRALYENWCSSGFRFNFRTRLRNCHSHERRRPSRPFVRCHAHEPIIAQAAGPVDQARSLLAIQPGPLSTRKFVQKAASALQAGILQKLPSPPEHSSKPPRLRDGLPLQRVRGVDTEACEVGRASCQCLHQLGTRTTCIPRTTVSKRAGDSILPPSCP